MSCFRTSPTSLPSEVVTGELSALRSVIVRCISWTLTIGRYVLGPGRMTLLSGEIRIGVKLLGPQQPEHYPVLAHDDGCVPSGGDSPVADVAESRSSSEHVGTSRRSTSTRRGRCAFVPSVGRPAPIQSCLPAL